MYSTMKNCKPSERTSQNLLLNVTQFSVSDTNGSSRGTQYDLLPQFLANTCLRRTPKKKKIHGFDIWKAVGPFVLACTPDLMV
jgi:hypothetical protein